MFQLIRPSFLTRGSVAVLLLSGLLAGCSSLDSMLSGDKIDYRSAKPKGSTLDVPPDLTQLTRDSRYQTASGSVSASEFQSVQTAAAAPAVAAATVAPTSIGSLKVERAGTQRWLTTDLTPEQIWPQLRAFWQDRGFVLTLDQPEAGVMETDWAENRAKIPQDLIRSSIGRVFDSLYSTGERDKFRTRVERNGNTTEVYISHRGMEEVYTNSQRDTTMWQPRPVDPQLEGEMLSRLMAKLGNKDTQTAAAGAAGTTTAAAVATTAALPPEGPARARVLQGQPGAALQVDDGFDRAWRRVGLALDRSGFTVEDRDRSGGLYFVRYADPANVGKEEPGFFGKLFGSSKNSPTAPQRYRIAVKPSGDATLVSVLNSQGAPEGGQIGQRIVSMLVEDLK